MNSLATRARPLLLTLLIFLQAFPAEAGVVKACINYVRDLTFTTPAERVAENFFEDEPVEVGVEEAKLLEDSALQAMKNTLPKNGVVAQMEVRQWFNQIQARQASGSPLTLMEHTALTFVLKEGIFDEDPDPTLLGDLRSSLKESWFHFTNREVAEENMLGRLPDSVLARGTRDEILFHQALFHDGPLGFLGSMRNLARDYIPQPKDVMYVLLLGSMLFSRTGSEVLAGALEGYALNTFVEHTFHRYFGHASQKTLAFFDRTGWLGKTVRKIAFSHTAVHHGSYGNNYVEQFAPRDLSDPGAELMRESRKARMDIMIHARGDATERAVLGSDYGNRLSNPLFDALTVMPFSAAMALFTNFIAAKFGVHLGPAFDVAAVASSVLFVPASFYLHPYLHKTRAKAVEAAGPYMKRFLSTWYVAWIARSHFAHHDEGGKNNQNLTAGADFIFGYQPLTVEQLLAMKNYDAIY